MHRVILLIAMAISLQGCNEDKPHGKIEQALDWLNNKDDAAGDDGGSDYLPPVVPEQPVRHARVDAPYFDEEMAGRDRPPIIGCRWDSKKHRSQTCITKKYSYGHRELAEAALELYMNGEAQ